MVLDHAALGSVFQTALLGFMALTLVFAAKSFWRRNRVGSYCAIGLCVLLLDYMSNNGRVDDAIAHRAILLTVFAVGLQIAWNGYRARRR
jgi:hypothetical protein